MHVVTVPHSLLEGKNPERVSDYTVPEVPKNIASKKPRQRTN